MYYIYVGIGREFTKCWYSDRNTAQCACVWAYQCYPQFFSAIVAIIVVLAIAGWPYDEAVTSVLSTTIALRRIWYVLVKIQVQVSCRSCKTPHNHHHLHRHHNPFCPPCRCWKKQPPIVPPNNNKWPEEWTPPINFICNLRNARSRNGLPQRPWSSFDKEFSITIFPTGGQSGSYGY